MADMRVALLAAALMSGVALPMTAQTAGRFSGELRSQRPAQPSRPQGRPPQAPQTGASPFRMSLNTEPGHVPPRGRFARLPWFGFVYVDPYWWAPEGFDPSLPPPVAPGNDSRPTGGLQLDVDPRQGLVYADGWLLGIVDTFSGYYRHLDLPAGPHLIEIVAPDYEPLAVELTVTPGRTTTGNIWAPATSCAGCRSPTWRRSPR